MMPELIVYLLKVNVALFLFCAGYYFILQRYTFHTLNRAYLLIGLIYSALYPFIDLSSILSRNEQLKENMSLLAADWQGSVTYVMSQAENGAGMYWQTVILIFWTGVIFMSMRLMIQLISLFILHSQSKSDSVGNISFRRISKGVNPFSFWRTIYLNPECHEADELPSILEHEQIHVRQLHTFDSLLAELSTIFYWFNPAAWLMKKAIKSNLEFITDQQVIRSGIDSKQYQYALLKTQVLPQNSMPVNNFHFLTIKKRIAMINKKPSNRINLSNYLLLLPAIMLLVLITGISKAEFAAKAVVEHLIRLPEMPRSSVIATNETAEELRKYIDGAAENSETIKQQVTSQSSVLDTNKNGSEKVIKYLVVPAEEIQTTRSVQDTVITLKPLYIIDGKRMTKGELQVTPEDIATINVLKGDGATRIYGADGKNGVIEIRTKTGGTGQIISLKPVTVTGYSANQNQKVSLNNIEQELIFLDGKEISKAKLDDVTVSTIESIEVVKGAAAVAKYGEKGKNGVLVIRTKKN